MRRNLLLGHFFFLLLIETVLLVSNIKKIRFKVNTHLTTVKKF
jgi:hypothetical protein